MIQEESFEALCKDSRANAAVLKALGETWKETNLKGKFKKPIDSDWKGIERISAVALYPEEWTPQNGWLTAAMKIARPTIQKEQKDVIDSLYSK